MTLKQRAFIGLAAWAGAAVAGASAWAGAGPVPQRRVSWVGRAATLDNWRGGDWFRLGTV